MDGTADALGRRSIAVIARYVVFFAERTRVTFVALLFPLSTLLTRLSSRMSQSCRRCLNGEDGWKGHYLLSSYWLPLGRHGRSGTEARSRAVSRLVHLLLRAMGMRGIGGMGFDAGRHGV